MDILKKVRSRCEKLPGQIRTKLRDRKSEGSISSSGGDTQERFPRSDLELWLEKVTHTSWYGDRPRGESQLLPIKLQRALKKHSRSFKVEDEELYSDPFKLYSYPRTWYTYSGLEKGIPGPLLSAPEDFAFAYVTIIFPYFTQPISILNHYRFSHTTSGDHDTTLRLHRRPRNDTELDGSYTTVVGHSNWLNLVVIPLLSYDFRLRYENGLLRPAQIRLVEIWLRSSIVEQKRLVKAGVEGEKIWRRIRHMGSGLQQFFLRVRSERIEVLLLQYIAESGCDMNVYYGIQAAQEVYDEEIVLRTRALAEEDSDSA
ncbi:hypothetical protein BJ508DRAFT_24631 [Ascobolus immersus RN42]|uniref:Uncharacterized protein n=1 Tax=Ascobolus immersus RN42 TaxID=1160509 RepID=A0A3N4HST7_ASCIM|nr:hypothetical protein BJ508DRAFT_24631 [Ascobolus immersus RN42]